MWIDCFKSIPNQKVFRYVGKTAHPDSAAIRFCLQNRFYPPLSLRWIDCFKSFSASIRVVHPTARSDIRVCVKSLYFNNITPMR